MKIYLTVGRGDGQKLGRFQARAADQRAIHVWDKEELGGIAGLHGAAIKDTRGAAFSRPQQLAQILANGGLEPRHIRRRGRQP